MRWTHLHLQSNSFCFIPEFFKSNFLRCAFLSLFVSTKTANKTLQYHLPRHTLGYVDQRDCLAEMREIFVHQVLGTMVESQLNKCAKSQQKLLESSRNKTPPPWIWARLLDVKSDLLLKGLACLIWLGSFSYADYKLKLKKTDWSGK